eukprot:TRINITY_DN18216_c0_g2_i2.p2 TRINITY_DN18216_c0_g2~~TRINITY_DN18216_c0_g2_i2.p2  ORF type:complete len:281 (+),score=81.71 TRINITY_DN18216_c0_g2_i2:409-1251(+)
MVPESQLRGPPPRKDRRAMTAGAAEMSKNLKVVTEKDHSSNTDLDAILSPGGGGRRSMRGRRQPADYSNQLTSQPLNGERRKRLEKTMQMEQKGAMQKMQMGQMVTTQNLTVAQLNRHQKMQQNMQPPGVYVGMVEPMSPMSPQSPMSPASPMSPMGQSHSMGGPMTAMGHSASQPGITSPMAMSSTLSMPASPADEKSPREERERKKQKNATFGSWSEPRVNKEDSFGRRIRNFNSYNPDESSPVAAPSEKELDCRLTKNPMAPPGVPAARPLVLVAGR